MLTIYYKQIRMLFDIEKLKGYNFYGYMIVISVLNYLILFLNFLTKLLGGSLGFTFSCLLREQFYRLAYGDRYFFTHKLVGSRFTKIQVCLLYFHISMKLKQE
jgi:hypothetical protein